MLTLPPLILSIMRPLESLFSERVWERAKMLLVGAILAPGKRTVTSVLQVMGLQHERQFHTDHRVLNRAVWSSREGSHRWLLMLVHVFGRKTEPLIIGIDETIERRRGAKIAAKGIYRDPVQSIV